MRPPCPFCGNELCKTFQRRRFVCKCCNGVYDEHHDGNLTEVSTYKKIKEVNDGTDN